jgi:hypothetical protein
MIFIERLVGAHFNYIYIILKKKKKKKTKMRSPPLHEKRTQNIKIKTRKKGALRSSYLRKQRRYRRKKNKIVY